MGTDNKNNQQKRFKAKVAEKDAKRMAESEKEALAAKYVMVKALYSHSECAKLNLFFVSPGNGKMKCTKE